MTDPAGQYVIFYDDAPQSVNAGGGGSRKNPHASHREKRRWEGIWAMALMAARVPKPLGFIRVTVELKFKGRNGRDSTNYYHPAVKPLCDALKLGGWIEDDTDEYVQIERVYVEEGVEQRAKARTVVTIQSAG